MEDNNIENEETTGSLEQESVDVSSLIKELAEAQKRAEANREEYLRAVADLENYRRRVSREKDELRRSAASSIIEELLSVMDNLALGIDAAPKHGADQSVIDGFQMVLDRIGAILSDHGLELMSPQGEAFDPNWHECVALMDSAEVPENMVIEVVRSGYRLHGRLLRAASVVVSRGASEVKDVD